MAETFNTEAVLKDILDVLRKHNIPVQTVAVNISMFDAEFDATIPDLRTYKAGNFYRLMTIDDVPMLLKAQRRIPFEWLVQWLDQHLKSPLQQMTEQLRQDFPSLIVNFNVNRDKNNPHSITRDSYTFTISCCFSDDPQDKYENYNVVELSIFLSLWDATSYPTIHATVGWLVDWEADDSWGLDVVAQQFFYNTEAQEHILGMLEQALPSLYQSLRQAVENHNRIEK